MDTDVIPAGTIVVGVDGSRQSGLALDWAVDQCALERRALTLAHAIPPEGATWLDPTGFDHRIGVGGLQTAAREVLTKARERATRRSPELHLHEVIRVADPRSLLVQLGRQAAMLVVGSRGRGPLASLLGSVGVTLTRHATCPVVVHRPGSHAGEVHRGVLVGVDGSSRSAPVLEFAYRMASWRKLPLQVVHCWQNSLEVVGGSVIEALPGSLDGEQLALAEAVAGLGEKYPDVNVRSEVIRGLASTVLALQGAQMNLIVVGGHHGGWSTQLVLGSVTSKVVEHASSPVAVVPVH